MDLQELKLIFNSFTLLKQSLDSLKRLRRAQWELRNYNYDKAWYKKEVKWEINRIKNERKHMYIRLHRYGIIELSERMAKKLDDFLSNIKSESKKEEVTD